MYFNVTAKTFAEEHTGGNKIAFVASDRALSWLELKDLSDKICGAFEKANIPGGQPVLVYGDKEAFFLASILSCYRKNLPFVPIGPELPGGRIKKIIAQTKSKVLINCSGAKNIPQLPLTVDRDLKITTEKVAWPAAEKDVAYVLFTSGSSGEPKGVLISNENIQAFTKWFVSSFPVNEKTVFINQASFLFDIALADFFGALQTGGTVVFNTSGHVKDLSFFDRVQKYKGSYWNSTPSFVSLCLVNKNFNAQNFPNIRCFTLSGENLSATLVKELFLRFPNAKIINAYGPTEACIFSSFAVIEKEMLSEKFLPISKFPAENISVEQNELIISGPQVGKGYLNGIIFSGRFVPGDLVSVKNNLLYYKGRRDEQIKFNGYRIELNEIKAALENFEFILQAECVPVIIDEKIKRLIAFVKLKENSEKEISEIKTQLQNVLPHYMVPGEIIAIKEFPLTASSKIDRKKLLEKYLSA